MFWTKKYLESALPITRTEDLVITMEMDKAAFDRHKVAISGLPMARIPYPEDGDTFNLAYTFTAKYIGECEKNLRRVESILKDKAVIRKADMVCLNHTKSIIVSVLARLTRLHDQLKKG